MPRIPQNVRERAIGMLNAGMTMNAIAMNTGCFTRAFRHLRQRFQATGRSDDRPRSGSPRVRTRGQDRYIRNTHHRNRIQTATASDANTYGTHNNRISSQTVRSREKTAIFGTPTSAIAFKLPQLLLLPPMVHITTV